MNVERAPVPKGGISTPPGKVISAGYAAKCCITGRTINKGDRCVYIANMGLAIPEDQR